jgi:hypothetical protein
MRNKFVNYGRRLVLSFGRPRPPVARTAHEKAVPGRWECEGQTIVAFTKSEARAQLKARLGIPRKGRLPVGVFAGRS